MPKKGQVDYTNARYAPVLNCVVRYKEKILIVQRSSKMRLYPDLWNGISGFLDDEKKVEDKAKEELVEEIGIRPSQISALRRGEIFEKEDEKYSKTWIIYPVLVDVDTDEIMLDWEAENFKWIKPSELKDYNLVPGYDHVVHGLLAKS